MGVSVIYHAKFLLLQLIMIWQKIKSLLVNSGYDDLKA